MMKLHHRKLPALSALPSHFHGTNVNNDSGKHQLLVQKRRWTGCHFPHYCITVVAAVFILLVYMSVVVFYSVLPPIRPYPLLLNSSNVSSSKLRKEKFKKVRTIHPTGGDDAQTQTGSSTSNSKTTNLCNSNGTHPNAYNMSRPKLTELLQHIAKICLDGEEALFYPGTTIPRIIHQQWKSLGDMTDQMKSNVQTFIASNPDSYHMMWEDADIEEFVHVFYPHNISTIFQTQLPLSIHKSDMFRYMVLQTFGGVYSDIDTVCLKPISSWIPTASTNSSFTNITTSATKVGLIVGVEADVGDRPDWAQWYTRQLQWCQWTMASAPNHEVPAHVVHQVFQQFIDARSVSTKEALEKITAIENVLHFTGPSVWTDAVNGYLTSLNTHWTQFRSLQGSKQINDVLTLSITGFSPGVGHMGSEGLEHPDAKVQHTFLSSWKN